MIQGVGVHGEGWRPQVDGLVERHRCLWFDNRGIGLSQPVGAPIRIELLARDALALLDHEGWDSAHIVGHSMGGLVALELAARAGERVRSLALLCSFARWLDAVRASPRLAWIGLRSRLGTRRMRRHAFLEFVLPPKLRRDADLEQLAAELEPIFGHDLADAPNVTLQQGSAMTRYDGRSRLAQLGKFPTLVMSAEFDPIACPKMGRALASGIPGAQYVEIPEAAHGVTVQCADRVNELLLAHFAQSERDGAHTGSGHARRFNAQR